MIDHFVVDLVANPLLNVGEYGVLLFHHSIIARGRGLQPFRPAAGAVVHAHDLDRGAAQAVGYDVGGVGYDEFARAGKGIVTPEGTRRPRLGRASSEVEPGRAKRGAPKYLFCFDRKQPYAKVNKGRDGPKPAVSWCSNFKMEAYFILLCEGFQQRCFHFRGPQS
jgi:hypothetical protein